MTQKCIRDRLENWGLWSRIGQNHRGGDCLTAVICERLRKAKMGIVAGAEAPEIDEADAVLVNRAWAIQQPRQKKLLRWFYVTNSSPDFICTRLQIKHRPTSVFDIELWRAIDGVEKTLDRLSSENYIPKHNLTSVKKHDVA